MPGNNLPQVSGASQDRMFIRKCIYAYRICDSRMEISCFTTRETVSSKGLSLRHIKSFKNFWASEVKQVKWRYLRWSWFITLSWMWVEYIFFLFKQQSSQLMTGSLDERVNDKGAISRYLSDTSANASGCILYLYKHMNVRRCKIIFLCTIVYQGCC